MLFFYLVALPVVGAATAFALLWLPSKSTGWLLRLDVGLAWLAALAALVLVPTDVAAALAGRAPGPLATWWRAAYWYGFAAQVLVLPLHMEFARSGEFTVKDRLLGAARTNLLYYGVLLCVAVAGLLLLLLYRHLQPTNVVGFAIAFSNAYGLVGAIFLLGFGLVALPRQLWLSADPHEQQRRVCHKAGLQAERTVAAQRRLSAAVLTTRRASVLFAANDPLRPLMDVVLELARAAGPRFVPDSSTPVPDESELDIFDRADLAALRRELKRALNDWEREQALYAEAVQEHLGLEDMVASLEVGAPEDAPLSDRLAWLWRCHGHFWAYRLLAVLAALCSLAIVVAEATIVEALPNMSIVSAALRATSGSEFLTELLCFAFLAYPCACAYYSLYRLGRFAFYRMVPRHTDAYSLCYSGLLMCRFAAPLAFNFMAAVAMPEGNGSGVPDVTRTVFYAEFGRLMMDQPLIGWQFNTFAPALLVPYMLLLASGMFGHAAGLFKRGAQLEFEDDWALDSHAAVGRRLLQRESENARLGLPPGLAIETGPVGRAAGVTPAGVGSASASADRLLGTLRGAAAAAAERAAGEAAERRGAAAWWGRLLARGPWGRRDGSPPWHGVEAQAARGRPPRLLAAGEAAAAAAGYASLPSAPSPGRPGAASRLARVPQQAHSSSATGGDPPADSPTASPPISSGGGMKAYRARVLGRQGAPVGGGSSGGGASQGSQTPLSPR